MPCVRLRGSTGQQGVATYGNSTGFVATTNLASGAIVDVVSGGGYGVYTRGQAGATLTSQAAVTVTGSNGLLPFAGYYIEAQQGGVTANIGGTLTVNAGGQTAGSSYGAYALGNLSASLTSLVFGGTLNATAPGVIGLRAEQTATGGATVDARGSTLTIHGANSSAIQAVAASGTATVLSGAITTDGSGAATVAATSATGAASVDTRGGAISTSGSVANAVEARAATGFTVQTGAITTTGANSSALFALTNDGAGVATVAGAIAASGNDSLGAYLKSNLNAVTLNVSTGASVLGGHDADSALTPAGTQANGSGAVLSSAAAFAATVNNAGTIGAWSDRALLAGTGSGAVTLNNTGTVTGFWALSAAADTVVNSGLVEARNFSDADGNGTRDTKRIATFVFGGGNDVMRNEAGGTLRVGRSIATTTVTDGQYLPDLMPVAGYATTTPGVEQVHFTQLERFEHRGTITLRDVDAGGAAPVAGDVLLMTSGTISNTGTLTAGAAPMVFLSDGGSLALDTELNEGGASSHSDMLVVDSVQLGPNGPTRVFISNAGGLGAATTGAGIKLVDVLGGGALSADAAFVLGGPVVAGAFTYNLFRSAPLSTDGDWYLRTAPATQPPQPPVVPPPTPPPTPPPPPPPPVPTYRPEAALFSAMPGMLRIIDASVPGTRQARLGDEAGGLTVARRGRAWARYVKQDIDASQQGTVAPSVNGDATGYQFGVELFGGKDEAAAQVGLYGGQVEGDAEVRGSANGVAGTPVGRLEPKVTYAGVYVSRSRGRGLYFDAVLQYGFYDGTASTYADGVVADIRGTGGYASLETGYGFSLPAHLVIEPQLQIVAQPQRLHEIAILNATVRHSPSNTLAGRLGVRLKGDLGSGAVRFQPYVGASIWQGLDHTDDTQFSGNGATQTTLEAKSQLKALEFNAGFSLGMGSRFTGFAEYGKLSSRGDAGMARDGTLLSAGLRFAW